jgi:hypothetical protein
MVVGVPETFLADVSTGNLATATTLDRPTELVFMEKQEAWREDLTIIAPRMRLTASITATLRNRLQQLCVRRRSPRDRKKQVCASYRPSMNHGKANALAV